MKRVFSRLALVTLVFSQPLVVPSLRAQQSSAGSQDRKRMAQAVDRTLHEGLQGMLPPHISTLLGLTKEKECPVMQGVLRGNARVQGFDVSSVNKNDVVLFVVEETTNSQVLYLTSRGGTLRKVVKVEAGEGRVQTISADDRKAFAKEKQFWLDRLAPALP